MVDANKLCSHPNLLKGIYKMGYQKPSKIQEKALPLLLQNPSVPLNDAFPDFPPRLTRIYRARNMIGQSQSGTGKTAAFALTMLSRIDMDLKAPQVSHMTVIVHVPGL